MKIDIQNIINESLAAEVRKTILNEENGGKEMYHITCEGEPVDTFETEDDAYAHLDIYKKNHPDKEFIIEKTKYNSYSEMIDRIEDLGEKLEVKETNTMEKKTVKVKNLAQAVLDAKEKGLKEFKVGEETYNVDECWKQLEEEEMCSECGDGPMDEELTGNQDELDVDKDGDIGADDLADLRAGKKEVSEGMGDCNECGAMLNEEGMCSECGTPMNESKKTKLRLTESELVSLISRMVNESVPGLEVTKRAQKGSGEESKSHMADVEKKLKDVSSFSGNDNPEFPKQIGKGEKVAQRSSEEENENIEDFRGGGLEDLNYDYEPSERFKERLKKALEGDSTMGNSQEYANVVKSDTGKNIAKKVERKAKKIADETTVSWGHRTKEPQDVKVVKESKTTMSSVLEEEITRMKKILGYDERTQ